LKTITREYINKEEKNNLNELLEEVKKQNEFIESLKLNI